jgi:hypothetical protein
MAPWSGINKDEFIDTFNPSAGQLAATSGFNQHYSVFFVFGQL